MRLIVILLIVLGFVSCNNSDSLDKYNQALPDSVLINDIISSVIIIDSLDTDYKIINKIKSIKVFKQDRLDNDSIPLPPPPPFSITYDALFKLFNSDSSLNKRISDSIFFTLQTDTSRKFLIQNRLTSRFNYKSHFVYQFFMPIYSFDKRFVYIQYNRLYGEMFSDCYAGVLKWDGQKWIKTESWSCGER